MTDKPNDDTARAKAAAKWGVKTDAIVPSRRGSLHFVVRRPPGPESDFVELEDDAGYSLGDDVARWRQRPDGLWELTVDPWPI